MRKTLRLTNKQEDEIWGEEGPYSEARLIFETRILDDSVSRIFVVVEANINPLTYKIIKQNKHLFEDDPRIMQLLEHVEFRGQKFGYVTMSYCNEYCGSEELKEAKVALERTKETIIKMHKFVMELLEDTRKGSM
jgi:hypothetical protein